jgi:hypothetical protein
MRFIADAMLGTLAKWLRVLGFDTVFAKGLDDSEILEMAIAENRIILSRDMELCGRKADSLYVAATGLDEQIKQVVSLHPPVESEVLSRCLECNSVLMKLTREEASGKVQESILARHSEFWTCGICNKYYWPGTHWKAMRMRAESIISSRNNPR